MAKGVIYLCDPAKNTECKKDGCKHNPQAVYPTCELTTNPAYSLDSVRYRLEEIKGEKINWKLVPA